MKDIELRYVGGHVEVYTVAGAFLFSADTLREAMEDVLWSTPGALRSSPGSERGVCVNSGIACVPAEPEAAKPLHP